jgi:hypothetical protein
MCLNKIIRHRRPTKRVVTAYKIISKDYESYGSDHVRWVTPYISTAIPLDVWMDAGTSRTLPVENFGGEAIPAKLRRYESGFHVYKTREAADEMRKGIRGNNAFVVRVKVSGITCEGYDGTDGVSKRTNFVAQRMLITSADVEEAVRQVGLGTFLAENSVAGYKRLYPKE